ncbi:MAG: hypothetical protein V2J11_06750, partial [Desulfofustis sp.]|nr:hypothetical protein [Desulfofustis sp.]
IGGTGFNLSPANFQNQPAIPTTAPVFIVRCDIPSWRLLGNTSEKEVAYREATGNYELVLGVRR